MAFSYDGSLLTSAPTLLALVAVLGYLAGRLRYWRAERARANHRHDITRALSVSQELDLIATRLRRSLAAHLPAVQKFSSRLTRLEERSEVSWLEICDQADELLKPAMRLSNEVSHAYAELLQQMAHLSSFAELRTDPLTGVSNRRAFEESLSSFLAQQARYAAPLSVAILDIDLFKQVNDSLGHLQGDRVLRELAALLRESVRDCDVVARYGGEEFVVLMPQTELSAACSLAERIRAAVEKSMTITISMGVAGSMPEDEATAIMGRADAGLYAAKGAGRNCVFIHEGTPCHIVGIKPSTHKAPLPTSAVALPPEGTLVSTPY